MARRQNYRCFTVSGRTVKHNIQTLEMQPLSEVPLEESQARPVHEERWPGLLRAEGGAQGQVRRQEVPLHGKCLNQRKDSDWNCAQSKDE